MTTLYDRYKALEDSMSGTEGVHEYLPLQTEAETSSQLIRNERVRRSESVQARRRFILPAASLLSLLLVSYALLRPSPSFTVSPSPLTPSLSHSLPNLSPPPTRVGRRHYPNLYHGKGCNSSELIAAVGRAEVKSDGPSRTEYEQEEREGVNELRMEGFEWSYDIEGCPALHLFTPAETCDLLSAFGGVMVRGDSLMRQFTQGLFLLLTSSFAQVRSQHKLCSGNKLFTNGFECKKHSIYDSRLLSVQVCPAATILYDQVWTFESDADPVIPVAKGKMVDYSGPLLNGFHRFVQSQPEEQQRYSPIFIESTGIHYGWDEKATLSTHILPFISNTSTSIPRPIPFFSGYPAVPSNKPLQYVDRQGSIPTKSYNARMREGLRELGTGESWEGGWEMLEWYNSTEGAWSYDGTHFDTQVALERALVFLNVLDSVWGEVVDRGGLVE